MQVQSKKKKQTKSKPTLKVPKLSLLLGLLVLIALIVFVYMHVGDTKKFLSLLGSAEPWWLVFAIGMQIATYMSVGLIWFRITHSAKFYIPLGALARLSLEKLSVDQFLPALGMSGNLVVYQAMKRLRLPRWLALEAILINILAHYIAYAIVTALALVALAYFYHVTPIILTLAGVFVIVLIFVPTVVLWLVAHKDKKLPSWLLRFNLVTKAKKVLKSVTPKQIFDPKLLVFASFFNIIVFLLDSGTLWAVLHSLGISATFFTAFIALILASVAATLSALPGGLGGFEAASVGLLTLMHVPLEAALAGTLILRGFTLWLPLLPGLFFARKDTV